MATDIGAKLKVDGESSYSKAMREASKNTRALNSELKLAEAEFKASGDAQKLYTEKGKVLREQLEEQKRAVQAATSMLEALAKAGYEQNSTKVMEWRAKLAQAKQGVVEINSAIAQNDAALSGAAEGYGELGEAMQSAAADARTARADLGTAEGSVGSLNSALGNIGENIGWDTVYSGLHNLNQKIDATIRKIAQLAKGAWEAGVDATVWADDIATQAIVTGIDTQTLQQWSYAARFVDTSVDTIVQGRKRLLKAMESTNKETALNFNALGVVTRNTDGSLRDLDAVFWDTIAGLGRIENETQRDALAMALMGKSASELNPLIEAGKEKWDEYAKSAPIVSEENINNLTSANDAIEDMNAQMEALKLSVLAELAPTIEIIASAISDAAKALGEFLESDEGQEALTRLETAIAGVIESFTKQDFGKMLSDASDSITGLIEGFASIIEDKDAIVNALKLIGGGVIALKLAEASAAAAKLLASLKLIKGFKVGGTVAGGAAGTAGKTAVGAGLLKGVLGSGIAKGLGGAGVFLSTLFHTPITQAKEATERQEAAEAVSEADQELADKAKEFGHTMAEAENWIASNMHEWGVDAETAKQMYMSGTYDSEAKKDVFEDTDTTKAQQVVQLTEAQTAAVQKYWDIVRQGATVDQEALAYQDLFDAFADNETTLAALDAVMEMINQIPPTLEDVPKSAEIQGGNIAIGLANGINANVASAVGAASALANSVRVAISSALRINSPSKVMEEYGMFTGQGFALGLEASAADVARASQSVLGGITLRAPDISGNASQAAVGADGGMAGAILSALSQMRVEIDGENAGRVLLPTIEEMMGEQTVSRRYD